MANDSIKIMHPTDKNVRNRAVPVDFVATGLAKGTAIKSVVGFIKPEVGVETKGKQILWLTRGAQGHKYRWMIRFHAPANGKYTLKVDGNDGKSGTGKDLGLGVPPSGPFEVYAKKKEAPTIDYPSVNGEDITDEAGYFVTYGSCSHPVILAAHAAQGAEYLYNDSNFWVAQFGQLTTNGSQNLVVTDSNDNSSVRVVVVNL